MEILKLTALELGEKIKSKEISCRQAVEEYLKAIDENDSVINAYITVLRDEALARADEVQAMIDRGELADSPLAGVPVAIKDNMCTKGVLTSAASNILNALIILCIRAFALFPAAPMRMAAWNVCCSAFSRTVLRLSAEAFCTSPNRTCSQVALGSARLVGTGEGA